MKKEELEKIKKYKDYPEGSVGKEVYDIHFMSFDEYLEKYYTNLEITKKTSWESWNRWQMKYLEPAYDENRHEEMIKNFGYASPKFYDFSIQNKVYEELKKDARLDDEIRKFIGFMAGGGFFKRHNISLEEWFEMENWSNPLGKFEDWKRKPINEILMYPYGINLLKVNLLQMPYWRR